MRDSPEIKGASPERIANAPSVLMGQAVEARGFEPIGWQFRFKFPTHVSNWRSVLALPMSDMKSGDGFEYETRYVYVLADLAAQADARREDTAMLDWLDATNRRLKMGWRVSQAPAGNVSVGSIIQLGANGQTPIREAIRAAMNTKAEQ